LLIIAFKISIGIQIFVSDNVKSKYLPWNLFHFGKERRIYFVGWDGVWFLNNTNTRRSNMAFFVQNFVVFTLCFCRFFCMRVCKRNWILLYNSRGSLKFANKLILTRRFNRKLNLRNVVCYSIQYGSSSYQISNYMKMQIYGTNILLVVK